MNAIHGCDVYVTLRTEGCKNLTNTGAVRVMTATEQKFTITPDNRRITEMFACVTCVSRELPSTDLWYDSKTETKKH